MLPPAAPASPPPFHSSIPPLACHLPHVALGPGPGLQYSPSSHAARRPATLPPSHPKPAPAPTCCPQVIGLGAGYSLNVASAEAAPEAPSPQACVRGATGVRGVAGQGQRRGGSMAATGAMLSLRRPTRTAAIRAVLLHNTAVPVHTDRDAPPSSCHSTITHPPPCHLTSSTRPPVAPRQRLQRRSWVRGRRRWWRVLCPPHTRMPGWRRCRRAPAGRGTRLSSSSPSSSSAQSLVGGSEERVIWSGTHKSVCGTAEQTSSLHASKHPKHGGWVEGADMPP